MRRAFLPFAFVTMLATVAHAEEPTTTSPQPDLPHASVRYNPLGLLIGRVSGDLEVWPTNQLSVVATPWTATYDQGAQTGDKGDETSAHLHLTGVEVGARFWPIRRQLGPFTFAPFVGLNGGSAWGRLETSSYGGSFASGSGGSRSEPIQQVIIAGEAGAALFAPPFIMELGIGAQWTQSLGTDVQGPVFWDCSWVCVDGMHFYYGNGPLPRVLLSAGLAL